MSNLSLVAAPERAIAHVNLDKYKLTYLWGAGICTPLTYVYLILEYERQARGNDFTINTEALAESWSWEDGDGKVKLLSEDQIQSAISKLEKKELLFRQTKNIQLELNF